MKTTHNIVTHCITPVIKTKYLAEKLKFNISTRKYMTKTSDEHNVTI